MDGVRVDHPDGLRDPLRYFQRLREHAPEAWIVGEKILARGEFLRREWPIEGTSGYDFLNMVSGLFIEPAGLRQLGEAYCEFTGESADFPGIAHEKKLNVEQEGLGSDINRLTDLFVTICENNRQQRDFTRTEIRRALREVAACFSIYRTYVMPDREEITDEDRHFISKATEAAKNIRTDIDGALFDFMQAILSLDTRGDNESEFVQRFQQFTSPVMAKGVEDTAFYCYNRLISLNEVGGDPSFEGVSVEEFHTYNNRIQSSYPLTLIALSTHDTKRSDDVRARLQLLSEVPKQFADQVKAWSEANASCKKNESPDKGTEWFLYQTLVGAWPIDAERLKTYMTKAMREAKVRTSWTTNNQAYEEGLFHFIESILKDEKFVASVDTFVSSVLFAGRVNSLSQTLMKHTAPGLPDLYQGAEIWDLSLVDPDNRRPVDYAARRTLLEKAKSIRVEEAMEDIASGLPKLWLTHRALKLRKQNPTWFDADAQYAPLQCSGRQQGNVVAYIRGDSAVTVAPRLTQSMGGDWADTVLRLPAGKWRNELTDEAVDGGTVKVADLFARFPVALLSRNS